MNGNVMIWGAEGGIGRALCSLFVEQDWHVAAFARKNSRLPQGVTFFEADVSDRHRIEEAVYQAGIEFEHFDHFLYSAGDIVAQNIPQLQEEQWQRIMDANLNGVYRTLRASLPLLNKDASIIVIGAQVDKITSASLSAYSAAKAGLEAFISTAAKEDRNRKYLVVRPLAVETAFWEKVPFSMPKSALKPHQVASAIINSLHEKAEGHLDLP